MNLIILIIGMVIYLTVSFAIGFWKSKKVNLEGFVASKNTMSSTTILLSVIGTVVGGGIFFAVSQIGFETGVLGYIIGLMYIPAFIILGLAIPKIRSFFQKTRCLSVIDLIDTRYKHKGLSFITSLVVFFIYFFAIASQFLILGLFLNYFVGIKLVYSIMIICVVLAFINIFIYSVFGGIKKDIFTDIFQVLLIFLGTIFIAFLVFKPNFTIAIINLPQTYFTGLGYGALFLVGVILFTIPIMFLRPDFWQRIVATKNSNAAKKAFFIAGPIIFVFYVIFTRIGMYAKAIGITNSQLSALTLFSQSFTGIVYTIIILAFLAAVMSSTDTVLNVASIGFARMFNRKKWALYISEGKHSGYLLKFIKLSVFIVGLSSFIIAALMPDVVNLLIAGLSAVMILAPAIIAMLFSKKIYPNAAFFSVLLGFISFIALLFLSPKIAFVPATFISVITYFIVRIFDKKNYLNK